jgi:hypothetical protein
MTAYPRMNMTDPTPCPASSIAARGLALEPSWNHRGTPTVVGRPNDHRSIGVREVPVTVGARWRWFQRWSKSRPRVRLKLTGKLAITGCIRYRPLPAESAIWTAARPDVLRIVASRRNDRDRIMPGRRAPAGPCPVLKRRTTSPESIGIPPGRPGHGRRSWRSERAGAGVEPATY